MKQKTWHVQDPGLILPEYLVEFEYITSKSDDSDQSFDSGGISSKEVNRMFQATIESQKLLKNTYINANAKSGPKGTSFHISSEDLDRSDMACIKSVLMKFLKSCHLQELIENNFKFPDEDSSNSKTAIENSLPPDIPNRTKFDEINEDVIKQWTRESKQEFIKYLNLFNNNLKWIQNLSNLTNLTTLVLSFNDIKVIEGLDSLVHLKKLDLNHNFISRIEGIENLQELNVLNLANNWVYDIEDVQLITELSIPISELWLKWNPVSAHDNYRNYMFQVIPYLKKLDGFSLNDKDKDEDAETIMTKELISSAINSTTPAEAGMRFVMSSFQENAKEDSNLSQGDTWSRAQSMTSLHSSGPEVLIINHQKVRVIQNLEEFNTLRKLSLIDNIIGKIQGLETLRLLEELSLEKNLIEKIEGLNHLQYLKKLDLGSNKIKVIENLNWLENLTQLSLEDNEIESLSGLDELNNLMELYIGNNLLTNIKQTMYLKKLPKLIILDTSGNEISRDRYYIIFHLKKKLKVLDGISIEQNEVQQSNELFSGRLTDEILESRWASQYFSEIRELDISSWKLKDFDDMFDESKFPNLRELNLSDNNLVTLKGFGYLPKLKILTVSANKLETLISTPNDDGYPKGLLGLVGLEVLDISFNSITDLYGLNFAPLKELKILNASNNSLTKLEHIDHLLDLREIDLSNNRIRQFDSNSFSSSQQIAWLRIQDNGLRSLANVDKLQKLQFLFVNGNRIADFWDVEKLISWPKLMELSLINNSVAKKPMYRVSIIKRLPDLLILDGREITPDEREKVESAIMQEAKAPPMIHFTQYPTAKVPVKLNAVSFEGVFNNTHS